MVFVLFLLSVIVADMASAYSSAKAQATEMPALRLWTKGTSVNNQSALLYYDNDNDKAVIEVADTGSEAEMEIRPKAGTLRVNLVNTNMAGTGTAELVGGVSDWTVDLHGVAGYVQLELPAPLRWSGPDLEMVSGEVLYTGNSGRYMEILLTYEVAVDMSLGSDESAPYSFSAQLRELNLGSNVSTQTIVAVVDDQEANSQTYTIHRVVPLENGNYYGLFLQYLSSTNVPTNDKARITGYKMRVL